MNQDLFPFLGIKIKDRFLDASFCDFIVNEIRNSKNKKKALIAKKNSEGTKGLYDNTVRNTFKVQLPKSIQEKILLKVKNELQPELENFFGRKFKGIQPLEFLSYNKSHFFTLHRDVVKSENKRKVSIVIFLNQQSQYQNRPDYGGGDLILYGLLKNTPQRGLSVPSHKSLMVAFDSNTLHEVTPVKWGNRCSLVIWFY